MRSERSEGARSEKSQVKNSKAPGAGVKNFGRFFFPPELLQLL